MKRLYIFMILVSISFWGCTNCSLPSKHNDNVSNEQRDTSSVNNKAQQDSSQVAQGVKSGIDEGQSMPIAKDKYKYWLFFSAFVNICLLIIVYKKNARIGELEDKAREKESNRWVESKHSEPYIRNENSYNAPSKPKILSSTLSDVSTEQREIVKEEEKVTTINSPVKSEKSYKYLMPAYQGKFTKLFDEPSGKTRFRCWAENGIWFFEFHGDLKTAVENYNATFDDTCKVEGSYVGATRYKTEEPGTMDKDWKILTKSIIRLY